MRRPQYGNTFRLHRALVVQRTADGTLRMFSNPLFPAYESLSVQFNALRKIDIDQMRQLFIASAGEEITILDHEGREWTGLITSNELRITYGKNTDCDGALGFDFQGVPI